MELGIVRTIAGDYSVVDESDEGAPLLSVGFHNEFARIFDDEAKRAIFDGILERLTGAVAESRGPDRKGAIAHTKEKRK